MSFQADNQKIVSKYSNVQKTITAPVIPPSTKCNNNIVNVVRHNTVDKTNRSSDIIITFTTSNDVVHNKKNTVDIVTTTRDRVYRIDKTCNKNNNDVATDSLHSNNSTDHVNATININNNSDSNCIDNSTSIGHTNKTIMTNNATHDKSNLNKVTNINTNIVKNKLHQNDHNRNNVNVIKKNTVDNITCRSDTIDSFAATNDVDHNNILIVDNVTTTKDDTVSTSDCHSNTKTSTNKINNTNYISTAINNNPNFNKVNEEDNIGTSDCYNKTSSNSDKIINTKYNITAQDIHSKYISHHHGHPSDVNHLKTDFTNEERIINITLTMIKVTFTTLLI